MAENVLPTRTSRERVAQNIFGEIYVPEFLLPCGEVWGNLTYFKAC
jgi:hypothetical protein